MYVSIYLSIYRCIYLCIYVFLYRCIYVSIYIYVYIYIYIYSIEVKAGRAGAREGRKVEGKGVTKRGRQGKGFFPILLISCILLILLIFNISLICYNKLCYSTCTMMNKGEQGVDRTQRSHARWPMGRRASHPPTCFNVEC